jgi:hypothetical protein
MNIERQSAEGGRMPSKYFLVLFVLLMATGHAHAKESPDVTSEQSLKKEETKELSGMSIVGNDEAPKTLYIVPWKSSDLGAETSMNMMLNERDVPVDREVFMRQLEYYEVSNTKPSVRP